MHTPQLGTRVAPESTKPLGPTGTPSLTARWRARLRVARPVLAIFGDRLPRVVTEAGKADAALLTTTGERAIDALAARPAVPLAQLEALGWDLIVHVRRVRGVRTPDLATAMCAEQRASSALDVAQWCTDGAVTLSDLHERRDRAGAQLVATRDLLVALDHEITRRTASALAMAAHRARAAGA